MLMIYISFDICFLMLRVTYIYTILHQIYCNIHSTATNEQLITYYFAPLFPLRISFCAAQSNQVAMATGQVLFQRFFYSKSFVRHSMEATAMSCVCLASKIEEAPRRIRDVINVFHHIKQVRGQK